MENNALVSLDGLSPSFPCHDDGTRWNGAVAPLFELDTLYDVARWIASNAEPGDELLSIQGAAAFIVRPAYDDEGEDEFSRLPRVGNRHRFDGWVWSRDDES